MDASREEVGSRSGTRKVLIGCGQFCYGKEKKEFKGE